MPTGYRRERSLGTQRAIAASAVAISLLLVAGCDKKPGGQVVAVVNSTEITQQELRAQADAAGVPAGQDPQSYAPAMLEQVIDRNLLAGYARQQGLDRGPEYVARRRQIEEALLASLAVRKITTSQGAPSASDVQAYIAANPAMFAHRQRLVLDQVRFATPPLEQLKALQALGSVAAIEAKLKAEKVQSARGTATLDTDRVASAVAQQVQSLPDGRIFDLSSQGITVISAITARQDIPVDRAVWTAQAKELLVRERAQKAIVDGIADLRKKAKIDYDAAFKPAKPKPS